MHRRSARYSVKRLMHRRSARYSVSKAANAQGLRLAPNKWSNTFKSSVLSPFSSLVLFLGNHLLEESCDKVCMKPLESQGSCLNAFLFKQGHAASMTHRVQRSYGHGWEGKADHLPVPAVIVNVLATLQS